ncbi:MAG: homoserine O-succinyltransferase [Planctomycetes bacterium]|nr:homoserine O-succinyltransferase [Planctomycetota bacterium]
MVRAFDQTVEVVLRQRLTERAQRFHLLRSTVPQDRVGPRSHVADVAAHRDGVVTGAPIAQLPDEDVRYWPEMVNIMDWTQSNVHSSMFVCWGVQAALYHFHGISRKRRDQKAVGIFRHQICQANSPYLSNTYLETSAIRLSASSQEMSTN